MHPENAVTKNLANIGKEKPLQQTVQVAKKNQTANNAYDDCASISFFLFIGCFKEKPKFLILRLRDFESFGLKFRLANNT